MKLRGNAASGQLIYGHIPLNMFQRGETLDVTEEGVLVHVNNQATSPAFDSPDNKWSRQTGTTEIKCKNKLVLTRHCQ